MLDSASGIAEITGSTSLPTSIDPVDLFWLTSVADDDFVAWMPFDDEFNVATTLSDLSGVSKTSLGAINDRSLSTFWVADVDATTFVDGVGVECVSAGLRMDDPSLCDTTVMEVVLL